MNQKIEAIPFHDPKTEFQGWRCKLQDQRGIPTPAIADGRLLISGGFGSYDYYGLDLSSGGLDFHLRTNDDGPTSAVVSEGLAAFNTESCTLEVIDLQTGSEVWSRWLGDPLMGQPAIHVGQVFMVYPHSGKHILGAFDLRTGKDIWQVDLKHDVITAPIAVDDTVYLSTLDGCVHAVQAASGEHLWHRQMNATSAPWIEKGEVFVAHREEERNTNYKRGPESGFTKERTSKFDASRGHAKRRYSAKDAPYLSKTWGTKRKAQFHQADASVGFASGPAAAKLEQAEGLIGERYVSRSWRFQGSRPVVRDGILYETTGDKLEARNLQTGELLWSWSDATSHAGERRLTPPAVANGRVWFGTWDGRLIRLDARTGQIHWDVKVGAPVHWQPVAQDGYVSAGLEDGSVISIRTDDADTGWPMWGGGPGHNGSLIETKVPTQFSLL